jgi:hypothetical protein
LSTSGAGLNKVALNIPYGNEGSVTRFVNNAEDSNSVGSDLIFRFFPADDTSLWVNHKAGIDLYHNNRFEHVDQSKGQVFRVFKAHDGVTYLGTTDGLFRSVEGSSYRFEKKTNAKQLRSARHLGRQTEQALVL